ncbi:beta-N-acetylglucosaminidase domain-containing protein [Marinobacter sp. JSM 1782161]|uniref:beta-N-acetylglucosaminidase domain-containing protein n=1 Tax=Marinobacter sp. JSM 1782161 TaxID=2685906 RepID=UPI0014028735|nr:beta-N-acetylglucosaminidase domain-containing protein [Marinobacter sp. JSM 1782161]
MKTPLGIIEGYFGRPWSWTERADLVALLARHGYGFYLYAPKADPFLRRRWDEPYPAEEAAQLRQFARHCRIHGVRFGIGLSPFEVYRDFNAAARQALTEKLAFFDSLGIDDLAILFDDMRGDTPDLAVRQLEILDWIRGRSGASRLIVCPTYYSDDPVLDRVFGERPPHYLETLGDALPDSVDLFWTGEEVCSREISAGHLARVESLLKRKPLLWDNYPVNDGPRMSGHLHLRAFTGRNAAIGEHLAGHAINPALQPRLSAIPALTLAASYRQGNGYAYMEAFRKAAREVAGEELAVRLEQDLMALQDIGLDQLGEREERLRRHYGDVDHAVAREIIAWLDGTYRISGEAVQTQ